MLTVGVVAYDLDLDAAKMPAAVVTFLVGVGAFAALGLAVASLVPNPDAAPAVANAIILPLAFVSDVFIQIDDPPAWVDFVGDLFPLKAFVQAFQAAFNPNVEAPGFEWGKLAFVAAWGVAGLHRRAALVQVGAIDPSTHQASPRAGDGGVTCIPS